MMEENIKDMRIGPEPFVDANAAGTYLKLHPVTVQRFARNGSLPAHPLQKGSSTAVRLKVEQNQLVANAVYVVLAIGCLKCL